jgi:hypothetical protein
MTLDDLENDQVFSDAIRGLSRVVGLISVIPDEKRSLALAAAQQIYLRTAQELGYDESDAQQWASAVARYLIPMTAPRPHFITSRVEQTSGHQTVVRASQRFTGYDLERRGERLLARAAVAKASDPRSQAPASNPGRFVPEPVRRECRG